MRCFILFAFFALLVVLVAAKAGPQHAPFGGVKHEGPVPLNGTLPALNSTSSANVTTTEASATTEGSATEASTTEASATVATST